MSQKKIALYVEGQTEQILVNHLVKTWWCYTGVEIKNIKILGDGTCKCEVSDFCSGTNSAIFFLIVNVDGEGSLQSSIAKRANAQQREGYEILGLRDLYANDYKVAVLHHPDKPEQVVLENIKMALRTMKCSNPESIEIFFSIMETEAWLLAFSQALSIWARDPDPRIPIPLEEIGRPSTLMKQFGQTAGRGDHKSLHEMISFVSRITREAIEEVYESNRVSSFNRFWEKILASGPFDENYLTNTLASIRSLD